MTPAAFIEITAPMAVRDMRRSGILASITIAQAALESGWGTRAAGNNLFGIKGTGQEFVTQEYINGHFVTITDGFRVYDSWAGSVCDHSDFLRVNTIYGNAGLIVACDSGDYHAAAWALQHARYATDPLYAEKLISMIMWYRLDRFDAEGREPDMAKEDAAKVAEILGGLWTLCDVLGSDEIKGELHRLANAVRQAGGLEVVE